MRANRNKLYQWQIFRTFLPLLVRKALRGERKMFIAKLAVAEFPNTTFSLNHRKLLSSVLFRNRARTTANGLFSLSLSFRKDSEKL